MLNESNKEKTTLYKKHGKRILDIILATVGIILFSPLFFVITLLVLTDSKGPIIYKQKRLGKSQIEFSIFKFRTMIQNADRQGPKSTKKHDSRITKVGKVLRKYSLDELPQLFNVLLGDMSFVGPRPTVKEIAELYYDEERKENFTIKPGITGYAQLYGRSTLTVERAKELELKYIKDISFYTDIKIIFGTIYKVIIGKDSF